MWVMLCLISAAAAALSADTLAPVFNQAVSALAAGDYTAAQSGFEQVLKAQPNNVGALGNLGVIYSRTNRTDQAIAVYRRALRIVPSDKGLLLNLGLALLKQESHADALTVFRKLLAVDPGNLQVRELEATCELYTGKFASAAATLESLRREDRTNAGLLYLLGVAHLKLNQPEKARQYLSEFLTEAPPARAETVLCRAYYESERFEEAAAHCRRVLSIEPAFAGAHRELGKVLVSQRSPEAGDELAAAVKQNPNDAEALYFLGGWLLQVNRPGDAVPYLERARSFNPGFWGNYFYLGKAKAQFGQAAAAIPLLRKAAELNGSESAIFYQLGRAFAAEGKKEEAARAMQRVRELKAKDLDRAAEALRK